MNANLKGSIYGVIAAVAYGLNPTFAKPLYADGLSTDTVLFYRYAFGALLLGILLLCKKEPLKLNRREILPLIVFGILFAASSLFLFLSFLYMDSGLACSILFSYPIMVAVIMAIFFKEKASALTYACIALALVGIALLYQGGDSGPISMTGMILVLLSSLAYAIYMVGINHSPIHNMSSGKLTFWALIFGSVVFIVRLNFLADLQPIPSLYAWGNVLGLAVLPTIISLVFIAMAIHYIGATYTAIIGALEPVTALVLGVVLFNESFTARIGLGCTLILCAVIMIVMARPMKNKWEKRKLRKAERKAQI